jgi:hypothetical protein
MGEGDGHFVHRLHAIRVRDLLQAQANESPRVKPRDQHVWLPVLKLLLLVDLVG